MPPIDANGLKAFFDYAHRVATLVILPMVGWMLITINGNQIKLAEVTAKIEAAMIDRYTGADAFKDGRTRDAEHKLFDARLNHIENEIIRLRNKIDGRP